MDDRREASKDWCLLSLFLQKFGFCISFHAIFNFEDTVGSGATGMNDPFRYALTVKVGEFLN